MSEGSTSLLGPERRASVDLLWRQHGPVGDSPDTTPASTPHYLTTPQSPGKRRLGHDASREEESFVSRVSATTTCSGVTPLLPSLAKKLTRLGKLRKYQDNRAARAASHPITFRSLAREVNPANASTSTIESVGSSVSSDGDLAATSYGNVFAPNQPGPLGGDEERKVSVSGISRELNKRLRHTVLNQHKFTNRFNGSFAAKRVERSCMPQPHTHGLEPAELAGLLLTRSVLCVPLTDLAFVTRYQLPYVRRRLVLFAMMLLFCAQAEGLINGSLRDGMFILLRVATPPALVVAGALLLSPLVRWWRTVVMVIILLTYGTLLFAMGYHSVVQADTYQDFTKFTPCESHVSMLAWLFVFELAAALLFALDFVQLLFLLPTLWVMHVATSFYMWGRAVAEPRGLQIVLNSLLLSAVGLLLLLLALRRLNRFERQSFVNSYVLINKVSTQSQQIRGGGDSELLAVFSNPRSGSPLQLGRELKFLLNSLPATQLAIEPAATMNDVHAAISQKNPRLLLFSGHSFMGRLAFEMEDGMIDLPPPRHFIAQLQPQLAPRLQCVCLNGCETAELGFQIVSELPWLRVICWSTLAEDAAARAFAQGFYDAVGAFISNGGEVQLELAYLSGLDRFFDEGFALGDPAQYLHPAGHPHTRSPQFQSCPGCCPPVHGVVSLLSCDPVSGAVHTLLPQRLRGMRGDESEILSWERVHGGSSLRKELLSAALHSGKSVELFPEATASAFEPQQQQQQRLHEFYAEMLASEIQGSDPHLHDMVALDVSSRRERSPRSARSGGSPKTRSPLRGSGGPLMCHASSCVSAATSGATSSVAALEPAPFSERCDVLTTTDSPRGKRKHSYNV